MSTTDGGSPMSTTRAILYGSIQTNGQVSTAAAAAAAAYTTQGADRTTEDSYTHVYTTAGKANGSAPAAAAAAKELIFTTPDYVVFAISLAIPLVIGVFFFLLTIVRKTNTTDNFLMGERSMNFVAVALSILASLINGIFVIGIPAEVHYYGLTISFVVVGLFMSIVLVSHIYAPKYQTMKFTSAYEYVEKRFNYPTRAVACAIFCLSVIIFLAVVLYVPALSFAQVTGLPVWITIIVTGGICTIYTTIGGMKAVVWTDAIQMIIMLVGLIVIAALGTQKAGGGAKVWEIAKATGRVNYREFSADPRTRHTLWTQMFGQFVTYLGIFISNQMMVQRYMAVATKVQAQATLYIAFLMFIPLCALIMIIGLALHATYHNCDPMVTKAIKTGDQIMPYFILDLLGEYRGVPGLLTASVFAAALSSVSAVINSLAAVCLEDFIQPAVRHFAHKEIPEKIKRWTAISIVIFFGLVTIGLSFLASSFTSKLIQATGTIWGVIGGPLAGIFIMGFFMPFCNSAGAISGMIGGLIFTLWISLGSIVHSSQPITLPVGTCRAVTRNNQTFIPSIKLPPPTTPGINATTTTPMPLMDLYSVSYAWYGVIGMGSCIVIGVIVSLATVWMKKCRPRLGHELMCLCCCEREVLRRFDDFRDHSYSLDNKDNANKDEPVAVVSNLYTYINDSNDSSTANLTKRFPSSDSDANIRYDNGAYLDDVDLGEGRNF